MGFGYLELFHIDRVRSFMDQTDNVKFSFLLSVSEKMASEAPSWADQWGAGGIGAMEDEDMRSQKETDKKNKNSDSKGGFAAINNKIKNGVKWIKNQCRRKSASK